MKRGWSGLRFKRSNEGIFLTAYGHKEKKAISNPEKAETTREAALQVVLEVFKDKKQK